MKTYQGLWLLRRLLSGQMGATGNNECLEFSMSFDMAKEEGSWVVDYPPLDGIVAGVGETPQQALKEFALCFMELIDFHIERETAESFLEQHLGETEAVQRIIVKSADGESKALREPRFPVWATPS